MREIHIKESILIHRKAGDIYGFWRKFENLPRFIDHLRSVEDLGDGRNRWTMETPVGRISWTSEIIEDRKHEVIRWRSLPGSDVTNSGSLSLAEREGGASAEATVELHYSPPGVAPVFFLNGLLAFITDEQIKAGLEKLKGVMESEAP
jgi:uncharacterized membrane protein